MYDQFFFMSIGGFVLILAVSVGLGGYVIYKATRKGPQRRDL